MGSDGSDMTRLVEERMEVELVKQLVEVQQWEASV